jgi:outer membrane receptor for ferrienterochelin and colicin
LDAGQLGQRRQSAPAGDGQEYNEILYQSVPYGNKFPLEQIARIEIIRGPGSAVYGGTAEFGVINIITKGAAGQQTASASAPTAPCRAATAAAT